MFPKSNIYIHKCPVAIHCRIYHIKKNWIIDKIKKISAMEKISHKTLVFDLADDLSTILMMGGADISPDASTISQGKPTSWW